MSPLQAVRHVRKAKDALLALEHVESERGMVERKLVEARKVQAQAD